MALKYLINIVLSVFCCVLSIPVHAAGEMLSLPAVGTMVNLSPTFEPALIKGLKIHPDNPLLFDFIVDTGNSQLNINSPDFKQESQKLIKYFLAALTVPEKDLWVNLSPYEKDRMIAPNLGQTQMGRDMLAQDYVLKQLTASMIYPEKGLGKEFWDKVYEQINAEAAAAPISMDAFNKVWIVADRADVYEGKDAVYVTSAHLKVMLEQDYLATKKNDTVRVKVNNSEIAQTLRQLVLPAIEREINEGKNFAALRQMYHSMILASWYKIRLKDAVMTQVYGNQSKIGATINAQNPKDKEAIFAQYIQAYKKGVFNFIKEEIDPRTYQTVPRKYFSGGLQLDTTGVLQKVNEVSGLDGAKGSLAMVSSPIRILHKGESLSDAAMNVIPLKDRKSADVQDVLPKQYFNKKSNEEMIAEMRRKASAILLVSPNPDSYKAFSTMTGIDSILFHEALDIPQAVSMVIRFPETYKDAFIVIEGNHREEDIPKELWEYTVIIHYGTSNFAKARNPRENLWVSVGTPSKYNQRVGQVQLSDNPLAYALKRLVDNTKDEAMGGIDFNTGSLNVSKKGNGVVMQFDQSMIDRIKTQGFEGVDFQIDRITPIFNLSAVLNAK